MLSAGSHLGPVRRHCRATQLCRMSQAAFLNVAPNPAGTALFNALLALKHEHQLHRRLTAHETLFPAPGGDAAAAEPGFFREWWCTITVSVLLIIGATLSLTVFKEQLAAVGVSSKNIYEYGSIPVVGIFFTYAHIWFALHLMFYPLAFVGCCEMSGEFKGIGIGWQGIVPRKAAKMAGMAVDLMTSQVRWPTPSRWGSHFAAAV